MGMVPNAPLMRRFRLIRARTISGTWRHAAKARMRVPIRLARMSPTPGIRPQSSAVSTFFLDGRNLRSLMRDAGLGQPRYDRAI